jgi:hypothetical protein
MVKKKKNREPKAKKKEAHRESRRNRQKKTKGTIELSFITPAT